MPGTSVSRLMPAASASHGAPGTQPSTTARVISTAATSPRKYLLVVNNGSQAVYIGNSSGVTTSTGFPIAPGGSWETTTYGGDVYGITASGTADVRYWEH